MSSNAEVVSKLGPFVAKASFAELFEGQYDFVWRCLRRLGVEPGGVDDAAQEVFWVAHRRFEDIVAGKERAFLFGTAVRVASDHRRKRARAPEQDADLSQQSHPGPTPVEQLERKQARELLDEVLDGMESAQRAVFVLYELEGMTMVSIAEMLGLAQGTVASRLRRARKHFHREVARLRLRQGGDHV